MDPEDLNVNLNIPTHPPKTLWEQQGEQIMLRTVHTVSITKRHRISQNSNYLKIEKYVTRLDRAPTVEKKKGKQYIGKMQTKITPQKRKSNSKSQNTIHRFGTW